MKLNEALLAELQFEAQSTRKMLEVIPDDKLTWKPHDKSMTLQSLASHIVEIPLWAVETIDKDELDFATSDYKTKTGNSSKELVEMFDANLAKAVESLKNTSDETLMKNWKMRAGDVIYMDMPKFQVMRGFILNHNVHHRGQLSVYLRLNNVPLPGVYGPTADEAM
ncbi:MAG TPA: DinB family protein [Ignavibacteria bacterium]|nr:DinB family protein [Ignavibacteria bacterium]